ncbi:NAD(P)H-dependent oxidoreductase [Vibrio parahaemolyticus]|nr:NAD(P)H-dependent oxidoreductase [Vibrio parahaemolyticus]
MTKRIGFMLGSLRKEAFTRKVAAQLAELFPEEFEIVFPEIGHLEMYNQDYDDNNETPESWTKFREEVKGLDGFVFVTPEYNRSVPPVLKNALDIASRPYGANAWNDKPGAIVSVSPGAVSGFGANHHLRQVLTFLNIHAMAQPEAYIGSVMNLINEDGTFKEDTVNFFQIIVDSYVAWFNRLEK